MNSHLQGSTLLLSYLFFGPMQKRNGEFLEWYFSARRILGFAAWLDVGFIAELDVLMNSFCGRVLAFCVLASGKKGRSPSESERHFLREHFKGGQFGQIKRAAILVML